MFRGEFVGINGGADFYASTVDDLRKEGEISIKAFLEMCAEDGIEPRKNFSGKFNLRCLPHRIKGLLLRLPHTARVSMRG